MTHYSVLAVKTVSIAVAVVLFSDVAVCSVMTSRYQSLKPGERTRSSPGAVARACNPSYREAEAGGSFELRSSELQWATLIGCPRSSKEGCTGPGRKRSRSKPPCRSVVGSRP
uniref:Uncharacterized protein n=1 Tax=Monopterus albus TaxID=43700 RepID=A0A3Q3IGW8_MONAL